MLGGKCHSLLKSSSLFVFGAVVRLGRGIKTSGASRAKPVVEAPAPAPKVAKKGPAVIRFKDVSFAHSLAADKILDKVNFSIRQGSKVTIMGQNGAGVCVSVCVREREREVVVCSLSPCLALSISLSLSLSLARSPSLSCCLPRSQTKRTRTNAHT
jgi:hypothetical protein